MDNQMFVVGRNDSFVDIDRARFIVSDVLDAVEQLIYNGSRGYTVREALNIALISDDFPVPD